jgi:hypothetical protein
MSFKVGRFYEFKDGAKTKCIAAYDNGWVFNRITEDFVPISNDGFVALDVQPPLEHKEIFRELKPQTKDKSFFRLALKIAGDQDINENYNGLEAGTPLHYEAEYGMFSELWELPRGEEKKWMEKLPRQFRVNEDQWDDDEEVVLRAVLVFRKVKEFIAEMNL